MEMSMYLGRAQGVTRKKCTKRLLRDPSQLFALSIFKTETSRLIWSTLNQLLLANLLPLLFIIIFI